MPASRGPRMTMPTQLVLRALMEDPTVEMYGLEITSLAGLPSGTIYPILARLEKVGWLESRWEEVDASEQGRPRRRYYRLNPNNLAAVSAALRRVERPATAWSRLQPGVASGESS